MVLDQNMINRRDDSDSKLLVYPIPGIHDLPVPRIILRDDGYKGIAWLEPGMRGARWGGYIIVYLMKKKVENCGGILEKYTMTLTLKMGIANLGRSYRLPCAFKKFNQIPQSNVHPIHI